MAVYPDTHALQFFFKSVGSRLTGILGDHHASHIEVPVLKRLDQTENIHVIGDAQVITDFVFLNISGIDDYDDLGLVRKLHQHLQFAVRSKSRKDSGSMVVVKQFSSEFQVELVSELADPLPDML